MWKICMYVVEHDEYIEYVKYPPIKISCGMKV